MARTTLFAAGYVAAAVTDSYLAGQAGTTARRLRVLTKPALMPLLSACCHGATTTSTGGGCWRRMPCPGAATWRCWRVANARS